MTRHDGDFGNVRDKAAACVHHYVMVRGGMACQKCGHVMGEPERPDQPAATPSGRLTPAQTVAVEHVCLLAEECAHPRFGHVLPFGTLNLTINAGYE